MKLNHILLFHLEYSVGAMGDSGTDSARLVQVSERGQHADEGVPMPDEGGPAPLDLTGKKKRKKRKPFAPLAVAAVAAVAEPAAGEGAAEVAPAAVGEPGVWQETPYEELLERVYSRMRKRGYGGAAGSGAGGGGGGGEGGRRRLVIHPPQVVKYGSKKSGFVNFAEIAGLLDREPSHLRQYLQAELGTSGTIDGAGVLVLKGKFGRGDVEAVLSRYVREYIRCRTCQGHSTRLDRDKATRLTFLTCNDCSARSTISMAMDGFSALTEKRSRVRRREGK